MFLNLFRNIKIIQIHSITLHMSNKRFTDKNFLELQQANHSPIFGYEDSPLLTLEESVEKLIELIPHIIDYTSTAKKKVNGQSSLLTRDESAAIYLYTMPNTRFFESLNKTLRNEDRNALKPWFHFLKLFITAVNKLDCTRDKLRCEMRCECNQSFRLIKMFPQYHWLYLYKVKISK